MLPQLLIAALFILSNVEANLEPDERIVNGVTTNVTVIPYQAALELGNYMCGGSLIAPNWILTAAHCTDGMTVPSVKFGLGVNNYQTFAYYKPITEIFQHAGFDENTMNYDISLLKIPTQTYTSTIKPIPLATVKPAEGAVATVSGYGTIKSGGSISYILRKADVTISNFNSCNNAYSNSLIMASMICASGFNSAGLITDSCQGDSGGPLVSNGKLVGVVSFGDGCALRGYPGIYTNVANYVPWINNQTGTIIAG